MNLYIAGPTDKPMKNAQAFQEAEDLLTECGHSVVNPCKFPQGLKDKTYMAISLHYIDGCDAVILLKDWETEQKSSLEAQFATYCGKMLFDFERFKHDYESNNGKRG